MGSVTEFFWGAPKSLQIVTAAMKLNFANKGLHSQSYDFATSHVWIWELDNKEGWTKKKNWYIQIVVLKTLENPLDSNEIKQLSSKGNQPWMSTERTEAEAPILWPSDAKSWLIGRLWCWEGLGAGGEGDDRGWDGWMTSPIQRTWVWANSGILWRTGKPEVLESMGSHRVQYNWATDWTITIKCIKDILCFY